MSDEFEDLESCEAYYSRAIAAAQSDEEELAIAEELLRKAQAGMVVNDDGKRLIYVQALDLPVDADFLIDGQDGLRRQERLRQALPIAAILVVAIAAVVLLYGGGGGHTQAPTPSPTVTAGIRTVSIATQTLTPTTGPSSTPTATATPATTALPVPAKEVEVKAEPVKLEPDAVVPVSLEMAGRYWPIVPTTLRGDAWAYAPEPGRASWLAGSYVNVVLGLPYSPDNLELLSATLEISDTLTLRSSVAGVNVYRVADRRLVSVYEIEALGQRRAGLTLVLLGGGESPDRRLVVWAVPAEAGKEASPTP